MDRITSGLLNAFKKQQSLSENIKDSELFEHFVNYYIVSKEYNEIFSIEDIHVGGGGDRALDGIAIIVNGSLINSKEEIEELEKTNKYLDVEFILIQSKTSSAKLQEETKNKIFLYSHDPIGYYISAYAKFRLDALFRKRQIDSKYSPFKYHMLNILRIQLSGKSIPDISSNKFIRYCEIIEKILWDETQYKEAFLKTTAVIDSLLNGNYDRAVAKTVTFSRNINNTFS
ncbi:hypothetical protein BLD44_013790 [Mastigocladus laminosus UU774]|nr:hypothetical protein BLD44_013790 [Mastigocladus laminosus UU774]